ncbi:M48 family metalloprotease [Thermovibrio ammonificans]
MRRVAVAAALLFLHSSAYGFDFSVLQKAAVATLKIMNEVGIKTDDKLRFDFDCKEPVRTFDKTVLLKIVASYGREDNLKLIETYLRSTPWFPVSVEEMIGKRVVDNNIEKGVILTRKEAPKLYAILDAQADFVLKGVKKLVGTQELPYRFHFYIYDSLDKNAFSLPGGYILVSKRLVEEVRMEERRNRHFKTKRHDKRDFLRFTLAHEISHNLRRHYSLKVEDVIVNGIEDQQALKRLLKGLKDSYALIDLKHLKFSAKDLDKFQHQVEEVDNDVKTLISLFDRGVKRMLEEKRKSLFVYGNFEKEADACALRILSVEYDRKELPSLVNNFLRNLPDVSYYKKREPFSFNPSLEKLVTSAGTDFKQLIDFYIEQSNFIHPSSKERERFLESLLSKYEHGHG